MKKSLKIDTFEFSKNQNVLIIAELSANHGRSLQTAIDSIRAIKRTGADAVKFQTYTPDTITIDSKLDDFKLNQGTIWDGKYLYDLYKEAYTPWEWHSKLFEIAASEGLICFSTPFDKTAVDFLEDLKVPAYKIASFEITDIPLIEYAASKGKPIIISTGIAGIADIELATEACKRMNNDQIILLKCTSSYPAKIEDANLAMIYDMANRFDVITGLSDHTVGTIVPVAAAALGARVIEKHFILDHSIGGPDSHFSMDEKEFTAMVAAVRETVKAIGRIDYTISDRMKKNREFSRSLYIVQDIKKGEKITPLNTRSIRPAFGLHPKFYNEVLYRKVKIDISRGTPLNLNDIEI